MAGANLWGAHLAGADIFRAHLEDANLEDSYWQGTYLEYTHLQGARCRAAVVDGFTLLWECEVDRETDFAEVGLGNARIDAKTRQLLEYNIRRKNWMAWYGSHRLLKWPVKLFWLLSDYGLSSNRILISCLMLALGFAAMYSNLEYWCPPGAVSNLDVEPHLPLWHFFVLLLLRPLYFSVVTMTTLGFGDIHANALSIWGHLLVIVQVLSGYVLLGALVTRFAILFTAGGPAGRFAEAGSRAGDRRAGRGNDDK
jgi:hypothetical protein